MIITIGRECGCGGNTIGRMLADNYGIPFYDKKAIIEIAKEKGIYERMPNFFAETPVNSLLYAIAKMRLRDLRANARISSIFAWSPLLWNC